MCSSFWSKPPEDEHVDDVGAGIERVVPHVRQDHRLGHDAAGVAHQVLEQRELAGPEFDGAALSGRNPADQVEAQVADGQLVLHRRLGGPADQRVHARQQFGKCERLGEVVVAAGHEARDAVVHRVPRAEDQHRRPDPLLPHALDHLEAIEVGQHQVDDGDVVRAGRCQGETGLAVGRMVDDEAGFAQAVGHEVGDLRVVLDEQRAHRLQQNRNGGSRATGAPGAGDSAC